MGIPWNTHGVYTMGFPWVFAHMKSPWIVHGIPMECTPWVFHGIPMVGIPWNTHGVDTMGFCPHEITMDCPWNTHGVYAMGIPWTSHGDFIWAKTHGKLMEYFHDISMGHFYKGTAGAKDCFPPRP